MFWINGVEQQVISVSDRAVQFGDGCFTTGWVNNGEIQRLEAHISRLQRAVSRLMMPECDWKQLADEMRNVAARSQQEGVIKVILSRGEGGRGYSSQGSIGPTRIMSLNGYPQHYHQWREQGIELAPSPVALAKNPLLAGIKHLNRLEQVLIRRHLDDTQAHEALVMDTDGVLIECCAANIFWRKGRQVFTPDLSHSGVEGLMRQHIISILEKSPDFSVETVREMRGTLENAEEVIVCNALMPILQVRKIENWHYNASKLFEFLQPYCC